MWLGKNLATMKYKRVKALSSARSVKAQPYQQYGADWADLDGSFNVHI